MMAFIANWLWIIPSIVFSGLLIATIFEIRKIK